MSSIGTSTGADFAKGEHSMLPPYRHRVKKIAKISLEDVSLNLSSAVSALGFGNGHRYIWTDNTSCLVGIATANSETQRKRDG